MISFTSDYTEGAHPEILRRLTETNLMQEPGYGEDSFSKAAKEKIREAICCPDADVFFLSGGTQTNAIVISSLLRSFEGVVAAETGHVAVHEAGAIELGGHKVLTLLSHEGKINANELRTYLGRFFSDPTWQHMVRPGMVYISFPTEYGTIYTSKELEAIHNVCMEYQIPLFIDGARLGYGLASDAADIDFVQLALLCDVFYIGGTKVGALCGEALVFPMGDAPEQFFTIIKQRGALLAKGRLLGIQFDTLFTDNLYLRISRNAIEMANELIRVFDDNGIPFFIDSPTNQQFPILTREQVDALKDEVSFEFWEPLPDGRIVTRFATSWATQVSHIQKLEEILDRCP